MIALSRREMSRPHREWLQSREQEQFTFLLLPCLSSVVGRLIWGLAVGHIPQVRLVVRFFFSVREVCLMQCDREAFIARRPWPTRSCCSRGKKWYPLTHQKPFGARIFFKILAHSVFKMWILQESKKIALWNKRHLEERKKQRMCSVFKTFSKYICWVNI